MDSVNTMNAPNTAQNNTYHPSTAASPATWTHPSDVESCGPGFGSTPTYTNTVNSNNNMNAMTAGKTNSYRAATGTPPTTAAYSGASHSREVDRTPMPSPARTMNATGNMNIGIKSEKNNRDTPTAPPALVGYPNAFQSGGIGSISTRTNGNAAETGKKSAYCAPTAPPTMTGHPSAFQSGGIESSSTHDFPNSMNRISERSAADNRNESNYHAPASGSVIAGYPNDFQSTGSGSSFPRPAYPTAATKANKTNSSQNRKSGDYSSPAGAPPTAGHRNVFRSSNIDSSSTHGVSSATNRISDTNAAENRNKGNYHAPASGSGIMGYPNAFQPTELGSSSTQPAYATALTKSNKINSAKNRESGDFSSPGEAPPPAGYRNAFQSGEIERSSTHGISNARNRISDFNAEQNTSKSNYHAPASGSAMTGHPNAFQCTELGSSSTQPAYYGNALTKSNKINSANNGKRGNYSPPADVPPSAGYLDALPSCEIEPSYPPDDPDTLRNPKHVTYHPSTKSPARPGYSGIFQSREIDTSPTRSNATTSYMKPVSSKGKTRTYGRATAGSEIEAYPSTFRSGNIGWGSEPIAEEWEEHIDESTNRKYFYNSITGRVRHSGTICGCEEIFV